MKNLGQKAWQVRSISADSVPNGYFGCKAVYFSNKSEVVSVQVGHSGSWWLPEMSPAAPAGKDSLGTSHPLKHRREEQPSLLERLAQHPRLCVPTPGAAPSLRPLGHGQPRLCPAAAQSRPARGSREAPPLLGPCSSGGPALRQTPLSRICQSQHVSPTSARLPSRCWGPRWLFSMVVFFLLKTAPLLCGEKGPVCGAQLHLKGTLLASYEFACLY